MANPIAATTPLSANDNHDNLLRLVQLQELTHPPPQKRSRATRQLQLLRSAIPPALLRHFDDVVRHGRPGIAMVSQSGACGSCHLSLPSGVAARLSTANEQLLQCPHCGCYMYSAAMLLAPEEKRPMASRSP